MHNRVWLSHSVMCHSCAIAIVYGRLPGDYVTGNTNFSKEGKFKKYISDIAVEPEQRNRGLLL